MTAPIFLVFTVMIALCTVVLAVRYFPRRAVLGVLVGLAAWLLYVGMLSVLGVVRNPDLRPPGIMFIVLPALLFIALVLVRSTAGARLALAVPLWVLLAAQSYRVGVELFLHQLWLDGLAPKMLTFEGANFDLLIGITAPLVAWLLVSGRLSTRLVLLWNVLGLVSLANVVTRAFLSAPGPFHLLHTEVPNVAIGTFPFTFIAGFFAPLAVALHVLALRRIRIETEAKQQVREATAPI